jgi:hypothetical protein
MKWMISFLSVVFALTVQAQTNTSVADRFFEFSKAVKERGWSGGVDAPAAKQGVSNGAPRISEGCFTYTFSEGDGYNPALGAMLIEFEGEKSIPLFNGEKTQTYGPCRDTNGFPLLSFYRQKDGEAEIYYLHWSAFRVEKTVIVFHALICRQETDFFMKYLTSFLQADTAEKMTLLKGEWKRTFEKEKDAFLAARKIQAFLKQKGLYDGNVDGLFGLKSRMAFQQYLKDKGYYRADIDGLFGKGTINAIRELQKALGVKVTGTITQETADVMEKTQDSRTE